MQCLFSWCCCLSRCRETVYRQSIIPFCLSSPKAYRPKMHNDSFVTFAVTFSRRLPATIGAMVTTTNSGRAGWPLRCQQKVAEAEPAPASASFRWQDVLFGLGCRVGMAHTSEDAFWHRTRVALAASFGGNGVLQPAHNRAAPQCMPRRPVGRSAQCAGSRTSGRRRMADRQPAPFADLIARSQA